MDFQLSPKPQMKLKHNVGSDVADGGIVLLSACMTAA